MSDASLITTLYLTVFCITSFFNVFCLCNSSSMSYLAVKLYNLLFIEMIDYVRSNSIIQLVLVLTDHDHG